MAGRSSAAQGPLRSTGLRSTGSFARPWNPAHISPSSGRGPQRRCDSASGLASATMPLHISGSQNLNTKARKTKPHKTWSGPVFRVGGRQAAGQTGGRKAGGGERRQGGPRTCRSTTRTYVRTYASYKPRGLTTGPPSFAPSVTYVRPSGAFGAAQARPSGRGSDPQPQRTPREAR